MEYPTLKEAEEADRTQLAKWYRFLPSPGINFIKKHENDTELGKLDKDELRDVIELEQNIMFVICKRFKLMGMFTSSISKEVGWVGSLYRLIWLSGIQYISLFPKTQQHVTFS